MGRVGVLILLLAAFALPVLSQQTRTSGEISLTGEVRGGSKDVIFVYDTFTDANGTSLASHTGELGATWTLHPDASYASSEARIQDNRLHQQAGTVTAYYASGVPPSADYRVRARIFIVTAMTSDGTAVLGRMDTSANTFYSFRTQNSNTAILHSMVAGSLSTLDSTTFNVSVGITYTLELRMVGTSIVGMIDWAQVVSATNSAVTAAGRAGVRLHDSQTSTTGFHMDSVSAYVPGN